MKSFSAQQQCWIGIATAALLLALPFMAFGASLLQGFAPIDDLFLIVRNLAIRGPTPEHLQTAFTTFDPELYIPLTLISFQLNYLISGLAPWSYHLTNIVLHGANAVLIFLILKKLTEAPRASLFAAALFAVHPINTEAVVWITARKDLLSAFFALAATLAFLRRTRRGTIVSVCLFFCALLAKVSVAPLPLVLPLLLALQGKKWTRNTVLSVMPFLLLSAMFVAIAILGKERIVETAGLTEIFLLAPWSIFFLFGKFLYPKNLSPLYEVTDPITLTNPAIFIPLFVFLFLLSFSCFLYFFQKKTLLPTPYTLSLVTFLILFSPALLTFHKAGTVFLASDRYLYLPAFGLLLFIVIGLREAGRQWTLPKEIIAGTSAFLIALLCLLSVRQTALWNSADTLFLHALQATPRSVAARIALAQTILDNGEPAAAFAILKEGLQHGDDIRLHLAAGNVYARVGQVAEALTEFEKARKMNPANAEAWFSIGSIQEQTGDSNVALDNYQKAVQLDASDVPARIGIARILLSRQHIDEAETALRTALGWNPNSIDAHTTLADVLAAQGRQTEADVHRATAKAIARDRE